jgi:hypothetical protein
MVGNTASQIISASWCFVGGPGRAVVEGFDISAPGNYFAWRWFAEVEKVGFRSPD